MTARLAGRRPAAVTVTDALAVAPPAPPRRRGPVDPERWRRYRDRTTPLTRTFARSDVDVDPDMLRRHMRHAIDGHRTRWERLGVTEVNAQLDEPGAATITLTITAR